MKNNYTIAIAGNPNVGKSTIFNGLTGMHQHTGNWPGKTVANASGICKYNNKEFLLVDIPGTYSLMSNSEEEEIARNYICFENPDVTVVVVDATCLERNLNLVYQIMELTNKVIVCVNLIDEALKKGIHINLNLLSTTLGVPVVGTIAKKKKTLNNLLNLIDNVCCGNIVPHPVLVHYPDIIENSICNILMHIENQLPENHINRWIALKLIDNNSQILHDLKQYLLVDFSPQITDELQNIRDLFDKEKLNFKSVIVSSIIFRCENICNDVCKYDDFNYNQKDRRIDKILTSKKFGIPIMIAFLGILFWITIIGANYPSQLLFKFFNMVQNKLLFLLNNSFLPIWLTDLFINGFYKTLTWIVSVMLPPMAIFFPLFTLLEDLGFLPRISFNLDNYFKKACTSGKQSLTMCMGFGCNACRSYWL